MAELVSSIFTNGFVSIHLLITVCLFLGSSITPNKKLWRPLEVATHGKYFARWVHGLQRLITQTNGLVEQGNFLFCVAARHLSERFAVCRVKKKHIHFERVWGMVYNKNVQQRFYFVFLRQWAWSRFLLASNNSYCAHTELFMKAY